MGIFENTVIITLLISASFFFALSEIALAASRKMRLQPRANEGDANAQKVLDLQAHPGSFFTVIQIGFNAVTILGGIVGESAFNPYVFKLLSLFFEGAWLESLSFFLSVFFVSSLYIIFADLIPKRLAMMAPEEVALVIVRPMLVLIAILKPFIWLYNGLCNLIFSLFRVSTQRDDEITSADIMAMVDEGAQSGVLQRDEHELLGNVFELEQRTVASAMTARESLVYFTTKETQDNIKAKIADNPHVKFLVVDQILDNIVGYVESCDILIQLLNGEQVDVKKQGLVKQALMVPDTLTLYEVLAQFKAAGSDFAVVLNEYALVMGVITLKDVMSIVMGELVSYTEDQIIQRDADSWLVDGSTPLIDVMRVLNINEFPDTESYKTIAGFMMYTLRKIPKRTDFVVQGGYKFEVVDIDHYKIDQLLVTRLVEHQPFP
ncbi:MAG: hemolysin family protein [Parachlamydiaceae bacterium]